MTILVVGADTAGCLANRPPCTPNPFLMVELAFYYKCYCHRLTKPIGPKRKCAGRLLRNVFLLDKRRHMKGKWALFLL